MPGKKKAKKLKKAKEAAETSSAEPKKVIRRKPQDSKRLKQQQNAARNLKIRKNERKIQRKEARFAENNPASEDSGSSEDETTVDEKGLATASKPHSSCNEPLPKYLPPIKPTRKDKWKGKKETQKELAAQQEEFDFDRKPKRRVPLYAANDTVPPESFKLQVSGDKSEIEIDPRPYSSVNEPGTSGISTHQDFESKGQRKRRKKLEKEAALRQENLPLKPMLSPLKNTAGNEQVTTNALKTDPKGTRENSPEGKKLQKEEEKMLEGVKEAAKKETVKSIEIEKFASHTSKDIISEVQTKATEDAYRKTGAIPKKRWTKESDVKGTDQKSREASKKKIENAIIGDILVFPTDESSELLNTRNDESQLYTGYDADKRWIRIGDESASISILVEKDIQVVCKSRRRQLDDLTCSDTLKDGAKVGRPDKDTTTSDMKRNKATNDDKPNSSSLGEYSGRRFQATRDEVGSLHVEINDSVDKSFKKLKETLTPVCEGVIENLSSLFEEVITKLKELIAVAFSKYITNITQ